MVKFVDIVHENVLRTLLMYIHSLCMGFGKYITRTKVNMSLDYERTLLKTFDIYAAMHGNVIN